MERTAPGARPGGPIRLQANRDRGPSACRPQAVLLALSASCPHFTCDRVGRSHISGAGPRLRGRSHLSGGGATSAEGAGSRLRGRATSPGAGSHLRGRGHVSRAGPRPRAGARAPPTRAALGLAGDRGGARGALWAVALPPPPRHVGFTGKAAEDGERAGPTQAVHYRGGRHGRFQR